MSDHMPDNGLQIVMFTHQDAGVWADMAAIVWGAGLQVTAAWYIATETTSELKKGGYVQGTVLLVVRKRLQQESVYRDELVQEVRAEVARQIETMTGLNQTTKGAGRSENLFEDQDLQMAGYAAALRVLTGYSRIDGQDMAAEALRPRQTEGRDMVKEIIDFAVQVANEYLVPEGIAPGLWERLSRSRTVLPADAGHRSGRSEETGELPELREGFPLRRLQGNDGLDEAERRAAEDGAGVEARRVRRRVREESSAGRAVRAL
jgi:hypothetical protein